MKGLPLRYTYLYIYIYIYIYIQINMYVEIVQSISTDFYNYCFGNCDRCSNKAHYNKNMWLKHMVYIYIYFFFHNIYIYIYFVKQTIQIQHFVRHKLQNAHISHQKIELYISNIMDVLKTTFKFPRGRLASKVYIYIYIFISICM